MFKYSGSICFNDLTDEQEKIILDLAYWDVKYENGCLFVNKNGRENDRTNLEILISIANALGEDISGVGEIQCFIFLTEDEGDVYEYYSIKNGELHFQRGTITINEWMPI